ncbi:MAG: hypothetical protein QN178_04775 [Armatimonadota bacterium]|nr:hypothetical protein [Armatimonadota bacterium]
MHEGDHNILDDEHDHHHPHGHDRKHGHDHTHAPEKPKTNARLIAGVIVAAAVLLFIIWRFV